MTVLVMGNQYLKQEKTTALPEDHLPKVSGRNAMESHRCEADHIIYGYLSGKLP